jgi:DNA modification methylase
VNAASGVSTLFDLEPARHVKHPAKFTPAVLQAISHYVPRGARTLDPFAGTGPNRYADHDAYDRSSRRSYTHDLRVMTNDPDRDLHPDNAGLLPWGPAYRAFHERAWREARRVLRPSGLFILNISNHIRNGVEQPVTEWHTAEILALGFNLEDGRLVHNPAHGLRPERQGAGRR